MSKVEQGYPAHPLSSYDAQRLHEGYWEDGSHGMTKRELVFLEFMSKLIAIPDQHECAIRNRASKAKQYTEQYFKTLEEWDDEN